MNHSKPMPNLFAIWLITCPSPYGLCWPHFIAYIPLIRPFVKSSPPTPTIPPHAPASAHYPNAETVPDSHYTQPNSNKLPNLRFYAFRLLNYVFTHKIDSRPISAQSIPMLAHLLNPFPRHLDQFPKLRFHPIRRDPVRTGIDVR